MSNQACSCPQCGRTIYFDGTCYDCQKINGCIEILALSDSEVEEKIKNLINNINKINDYEKDYHNFINLFCYRGINTERIAEKALENDIFCPSKLYRNASEKVRDKLIELLKDDKCEDANDIQNSLAMIGGEKVLEAFIELEKNPREWRKKLYVNPSVYAYAGGWTF